MLRIGAVEIVGLDTVTSRHPDIDARAGAGLIAMSGEGRSAV